jgi:hypothetical protein
LKIDLQKFIFDGHLLKSDQFEGVIMSFVKGIRSCRRSSPLSFREALFWGLVLAWISVSVAAGVSSPPDRAGVSDPGLSDSGELVKFIFDWGDGTTSETDFVSSGEFVSLSHSWSREGVYLVRVRAEDGLGASSNWSEPLEVTIAPKINRVSSNIRSRIL